MLRFFKDTRRSLSYVFHAAKSDLKNEVANSYLNWIWWIVDPLLFMLIYTFVFTMVFENNQQYFPVFVFIGLTIWNFFLRCVQGSTKIVRDKKGIISKVYMPKFVLLYVMIVKNLFKLFISIGLTFVLMAFFKVPFSYNIAYLLPIILTLTIVTFGVSTIFLNIGVYINDISNVVQALLRLMFYLSGIFYSIKDRLGKSRPGLANALLVWNPTAAMMDLTRTALLRQSRPSYRILGVWFLIGLAVSAIGVVIIYRNENNYVKVI